jgi:REP element-mobilizing transposase RayT
MRQLFRVLKGRGDSIDVQGVPEFDYTDGLSTPRSAGDSSDNMGSTYTKLQYHLVFSTCYRNPWIAEDWERRLYAFINGCLRHVGCMPLEIGGSFDHVHILTGMKATHRVCDVLCDIKSGSSRWIHDTLGIKEFHWQEGYGAFTTSAREDLQLREYIRNQKLHHQKTTFLDEYRDLLNEAGIKWDPRYLE